MREYVLKAGHGKAVHTPRVTSETHHVTNQFRPGDNPVDNELQFA